MGLLSDFSRFFQAILEQKREAELEEVNKTKKATVSSFVARSERIKKGGAGEIRMFEGMQVEGYIGYIIFEDI